MPRYCFICVLICANFVYFFLQYYEEFSDVFDSVVFYIKANAPISFILLIFDTLFLAFSNTTFNSEDLLHSMKNATDLKVVFSIFCLLCVTRLFLFIFFLQNLVKQMIRSFVKTAQDALPIVRLSFRYILKNLNHLHFFFVLSYFVEKLGLDDCTVLLVQMFLFCFLFLNRIEIVFRYDNLKTEIPREHHNHPGFLNFMCTLKNRTTKTAKPRGETSFLLVRCFQFGFFQDDPRRKLNQLVQLQIQIILYTMLVILFKSFLCQSSFFFV